MTIRTQAELLALFADNAAGDISAQDLRDFVDTYFQAKTVHAHGSLFAFTEGAGKPTVSVVGAINYLAYAVADQAWFHVTLPADLDDTQDITLHIDWFPEVAEGSKTVTWEVAYTLFDGGGELVNGTDGTLTATDEAVPATQWEEASTQVTIPLADVSASDHELRIRLSRIASTNDPTNVGAHHVWAECVTKPSGAS